MIFHCTPKIAALAVPGAQSFTPPSAPKPKTPSTTDTTSFTPQTANFKATGDELLLPYAQAGHSDMLTAVGNKSIQSPQARITGSPL